MKSTMSTINILIISSIEMSTTQVLNNKRFNINQVQRIKFLNFKFNYLFFSVKLYLSQYGMSATKTDHHSLILTEKTI